MIDLLRDHSRAVIFVSALIVAAGIFAALKLPAAIFPDVTFPRIVILADYGDEPAEKVLVTVTRPLEEAANSIPGVRLVRSTTSRGSSEISINFQWGTDMMVALQLLQSRVSSMRSQLPPEVSTEIEWMNPAVFPILGYSLVSDKRSLVELRDIALYTIRPRLMRVPGVAQIQVIGGNTREYAVRLDPVKLAAFRLDAREVVDVLSKTNVIASTGLIDAHYLIYLTLVDGLIPSIDEINNVVVGTRGDMPIYLKDVATISPSVAPEYIRVTSNGRDAVLLNILRQPGANTVQVAAGVEKSLLGITAYLPKDVHILNFYDQASFVTSSVNSVRDSIAIGVLLAMLVLLIFLRSWRVTLVAVVVIPVTVASTLLLLALFRETLNIMTLGGIAAAIGLIIDDTIVVVENYFRHLEQRPEEPLVALRESMKEILPAVIGSSFSTIVIFIPFAFLSGVTGAFFKSLSVAMASALAASFLLSITLTPLLGFYLTRDGLPGGIVEEKSDPVFLRIYEKTLRFLFRRPIVVVAGAIALAGFGVAFYFRVGSGFMPEMDEGAFILDYNTPPGTSLDETDRVLRQVEKTIMSIPEVESYSRRTGTQLGFFLTEPNRGDYLIKLSRYRSRNVFQIIDELRGKIERTQPSLRIDFGQALQDLIGDLTSVPSPIEIKLFGDSKSVLEAKAKEVAEQIRSVPGVVDVFDGVVISGPAVVVRINGELAGKAGLTVDDVQRQLAIAQFGKIATMTQRGQKLIGIRVEYQNKIQQRIDRLASIPIASPKGYSLLLGSIAQFSVIPGVSEIHQESQKPMVAVTARISGRDLGSTMAEIKRIVSSSVLLPQGVTIEYGGQYASQQESFRGLLLVLVAASLLVFLVLIVAFDSFRVPIAVYGTTVLSLSGVMAALAVTHVTFSISSFVGAIMVVGIVAENSVFLLHYVILHLNRGEPLDESLLEAGRLRLRPIVMTTLAAVLALLPLALGLGAGAQMQQPLAVAVIGGFSVSSFLILLILPVFYRSFVLLGKRKEVIGSLEKE
ncbi:MAG: efflux RND transporter permease subunit [Bacteroidota bacterium]